MATTMTAQWVKGAPVGRHADATVRGLYLRVLDNGAGYWEFRFQRNGDRRVKGLGSAASVSLKEARQRASELRLELAAGRDPLVTSGRRKAPTFAEAADAFLAKNAVAWRNPKHRQQWENTLASSVFPIIGEMSIDAVDTAAVQRVLDPLWKATPETASRVRGRIEAILSFAKVQGWRTGENPALWRGHLDQIYPRRAKVQPTVHHEAMGFSDVPAFMARLRAKRGVAAEALRFAILTAARTGEVLGMQWSEVDLERGVWTLSGARMKGGREHRVPLPPEAVALLRARPGFGEYVFQRVGRPLSSTAMLMTLRDMGEQVTVHGFRSSFRDWAGETASFPREVVEHALAHGLKDKAEAAYARGTMFDKRKELMAAWGEYLSRL